MTARHAPLRVKVLLLALLNVALLAAAFSLFVALQFGRGFDSFLLGGAGSRMQGIARDLEGQLRATPEAQVPALLQQYAERHHVALVLAENTGLVVGGPVSALPEPVARRLGDRPPPPNQARRPPPPSSVFLVTASSPPKYWAGVRMPIETADRPGPRRGTLLFVSERFYTDPFFFDIRPWLALVAAVLVLSALCWWPFVRRISRETARAELVAEQRRFLGHTAHELRSPLARMQLALDLLEAQNGEAVAAKAGQIRDDVREMMALTDALLESARAEAASQSSPLEPVDVRAMVDEAVRMESRPNASIEVAVEPGLKVKGRREPLTRALANVLRNAVFYAPDGGPIRIDAARGAGGVTITVADAGPGVPEAALAHLFTPFYRVDPSRARSSGGAGLGLAIARAAIDACGGRISCRNRRPHGLEVTATLPEW